MRQTFTDMKNVFGKMTLPKVANASKIWSSFHYARATGRARICGLPISVSVEPTTSCNLRCPECPSGLRSFTRPTGMLNPDFFKDVIDQLAPTLTWLTFYFQGEPFLNPSFLPMVAYASSKGIYTSTSTNAHFLNDDAAKATVQSGLDRLIISIDGTTQDTYEQYRIGGALEKVLDGTRNVLKWKRALRSATPHVIFQFLVVKPNEYQVADVAQLGKEMGVDQVVYKTAQIYDYKNGSPLIPDNPNFSRYHKTTSGAYAINNAMENHCWKMWQSCVITWDGKVLPCCFDKDGAHVMGDLSKNSFAEIWNGDAYQSFRSSLLRSRKEIEICRNCTEGTKVWA